MGTLLSVLWELLKSVGVPLLLLVMGAGVARTWQHRNWLIQQRIADQDRLNSETKKLFDDFVELSSKRHFRTQRLYWALRSADAKRIESERSKYDEIVFSWNDAEISWKVRFVKNLVNGWDLSREIDDAVRVPFVACGQLLERGIKRFRECELAKGLVQSSSYLSSDECNRIDAALARISQSVFVIGREIYGKIDVLAAQRLDGNRIIADQLKNGRYEELSLLQLFKATLTTSTVFRV